jgi:xanthine/CO dehydrogenase XdhC/CoxF family maturation factor
LAADLPAGAPDAAVFRQTVAPPLALTVFGAGDDARPLVRLAKELGWYVTVADPRPAYATAERFPQADRRIVAPAAGLARSAVLEPGAAAVVMTHHYVHDVPVLRALLERPPAYVGLLGPKQRGERILADLAREGVLPSAETLARFHSPVGLDLGAETPDEVALSIIAEIQAALAGRDGRPLRLRRHPIHA